MYSPIDEIKSRLDIVEVISSYIKLTKAGRNWKALCPFHTERTPSFMVSQERQLWRCFGCGKGGDIFTFVMEIEGGEFGDALRTLAQRAGVVLKRQDPQLRTRRQRLYEICDLAGRFFEKQLWESKTGKEALNYLIDRGLQKKTIKQWRLGFAPNDWHALEQFLINKGYKEDEIFNAGLTVKKEQSVEGGSSPYYDRFRSRIIFPIFDINSQVIGFGGRIFGQETDRVGKYINTPQTLLYDKSLVLYGLNRARQEIRKNNQCIIVEGYTDVLMSDQAGISNLVASSGTSLTPQQLKIIGRYTDNLAFAFDMDTAGEAATKRGIETAQQQGFNIKIIQLPSDKDPADLIKHTPVQWKKAINSSVRIMDFYFQDAFDKFDKATVEGKKEISKVLLPIIKRIPNRIEQAHWLQELAGQLKIEEKVLADQMKMLKTKSEPSASQEMEPKVVLSRQDYLERRLVGLILGYPENISLIKDIDLEILENKFLVEVLDKLKSEYDKNKNLKINDFLKKNSDFTTKINQIIFEIEQTPLLDEKEIKSEIETCLRALTTCQAKNGLTKICFEIKEAEKNGDQKRLQTLLGKFNQLAKKLSI